MSPTSPSPAFLTPAEVAAQLRLSVQAIYELCDSGELPCHRVGAKGGRRRIAKEDLDAYLAKTRRETPAPTVLMPTAARRKASREGAGGYQLLRAAGWRG